MNLWQVIYNEGIMKVFIPVLLDNFSSKDIASLSIREVPAIVISAENQPAAIFEGPQKCSQWLNNFTFNRRKNLAQQVDQQRKLIQKAQAEMRIQEDGAIEYAEAEMDGISDNYAYNHTDLCHPKNFVAIGDEDKYSIMTPQLIEGKVDEGAMKKYLAELESSRMAENTQFMKHMEQSQIKSVINNRNN
jgi:thioredoxin-like negative regulator of GroEL